MAHQPKEADVPADRGIPPSRRLRSRGPYATVVADQAWSAGGIAAADKLMLDLTIALFNTDDFQQGLEDPQKGLDALLAVLARGEQPAIGPDSPGITFRGR